MLGLVRNLTLGSQEPEASETRGTRRVETIDSAPAMKQASRGQNFPLALSTPNSCKILLARLSSIRLPRTRIYQCSCMSTQHCLLVRYLFNEAF